MKCLFVIIDGLGDRPIPELNNKTPLEYAKTPNLDFLAKNGECGLMDPISPGIRPGSNAAHLSIFGYDYTKHNRGTFEAAGAGIELEPGDIAFRTNFATLEGGIIKDRRAGRIKNTSELEKEIKKIELKNAKFIFKRTLDHRGVLVLRGKGLSEKVSETDPHVENVKYKNAIALSKEAKRTEEILNEFLSKAQAILEKCPLNKKRIKNGKPPANCILTRGAGKVEHRKGFYEKYGLKAASVAGAALYKGIGKILGMDVYSAKGADGSKTSNLKAKAELAKSLGYDFVYLHFKASDNFSEDGDFLGKAKYIEKVDSAIGRPETLVVITGDHSTSSISRIHTGDPVPICICGKNVRPDGVKEFGERACSKGSLHRICGKDVMPLIINYLDRAEILGE